MNRADRSTTGGDGQDGDADPAPPPRPAGGTLWWAVGAAVVLAQVLLVAVIGGHWRGAGAALLAVLTLAVVGAAMTGRRNR
ncbi:hypothetical protein GCM10009839_19390 [Catenulispora yoronensis]|uniref:Uncharacterized protein n=1 Tax=Catenulispora yoronensis TaxID=450799 RepID=A0ABN2TUQ7_9ACTN